jgi:hypothetical protein
MYMRTRKELPKTALPGIYFIDRQIAGGLPNTRELATAYETSAATISRDIDFMQNMLNALIAYDREHNGYYYMETRKKIKAKAGEYFDSGDYANAVTAYSEAINLNSRRIN